VLQNPFATSVHQIYNILLIACKRKGLPPGSPLFPLSSTILFCIKVLLLMLFAYTKVTSSLCLWQRFFNFSCIHGAFPTIRHYNIYDFTASLLSEVCHNIKIENYLQLLTGRYKTVVCDDNAHLNIRSAGFFG